MSTSTGRRVGLPIVALALLAGATALRMARLSWQPLWWDEGYSIYFATEPLGRMLWLTARDIHPPLYYALLHIWATFAGDGPEATRLFSVLIGVIAVGLCWWTARTLFPQSTTVAWLSALLLAVSPFHLYYSHEARMYGLALALGLASTVFCWKLAHGSAPDRRRLTWLGYVLASTAALYTLYYLAFLILAQTIWLLTTRAVRQRAWKSFLAAWGAICLLFLPWLLYTVPMLVEYVGQKVASDQDTALGFFDYVLRHVRALLVGHVAPASPWITYGSIAALVGVVCITAGVVLRRRETTFDAAPGANPVTFLALLIGVPFAAAFLLNLRLPFFPDGGERLLLFVLPYAILLLAFGISRAGIVGIIGLVLLLVGAASGILVFFTTPRNAAEDYRPVIRQIASNSQPGDGLLTLFPWMVGYWRAYAPDALRDVQVFLPGEGALEYGPEIEAEMERALQTVAPGAALWFAEPLALGSTLPGAVEKWLLNHTVNVGNQWFGDAIRLSAWTGQQPLAWEGREIRFGEITLAASATISPTVVEASNALLPVGLAWRQDAPADETAVSLRLVDDDGRIWARREYAPLGAFAQDGRSSVLTETVAMMVPAGTPPGDYTLALALANAADLSPIPAASTGAPDALQTPLAHVRVEAPAVAPALDRVSMTPVERPRVVDGLTWLGSRPHAAPAQAGDDVDLEWVGASLAQSPPLRNLYTNLVDGKGNVLAGWEGWPLAWYPTTMWSQDLATRVPVQIHLPAWLEAGTYGIEGGWIDPESGERSPATRFGELEVTSRPFVATRPESATPVDPAAQFGTHARLVGYTLERSGSGVTLALVWEVLETLLPPHHIFVHADNAAEGTLAQADGPPITAGGLAPTGSWRAGEYVVTRHVLDDVSGAQELLVGLYEPTSMVRLPVSLDGIPAGDAFTIPLPAGDAP